MNNDLRTHYYSLIPVKLVPSGTDENGQALYDIFTREGDMLLAEKNEPTEYMAKFLKEEHQLGCGCFLGVMLYDQEARIVTWDAKGKMSIYAGMQQVAQSNGHELLRG